MAEARAVAHTVGQRRRVLRDEVIAVVAGVPRHPSRAGAAERVCSLVAREHQALADRSRPATRGGSNRDVQAPRSRRPYALVKRTRGGPAPQASSAATIGTPVARRRAEHRRHVRRPRRRRARRRSRGGGAAVGAGDEVLVHAAAHTSGVPASARASPRAPSPSRNTMPSRMSSTSPRSRARVCSARTSGSRSKVTAKLRVSARSPSATRPGLRARSARSAIHVAKASLSHRSSHHTGVTRSPNQWCATSCAWIVYADLTKLSVGAAVST